MDSTELMSEPKNGNDHASAPARLHVVRGESRIVREDTLASIVQLLEDLYEQQELSQLVEAIEQNILSAYFGLRPDLFQSMLESIIAAGVDHRSVARGLLMIFSGMDNDADLSGIENFHPTGPYGLTPLLLLGKMSFMRMSGLTHETLPLLDELDKYRKSVALVLSDKSGMGIMLPVQAGITAMLAGEFDRAINYFVQAELQPIVGPLDFLTRDAYAKEALIHGAFGRVSDAQRALDLAATIQPSDSWVNAGIYATEELTQVFIDIDDHEQAMKRLDAMSLHSLGEMWPFYMVALRRVLGRAGRPREIQDRVSRFEQIPFPRVDGKAMPGSVFPLTRVNANIRSGDFEVAREVLAEADPDYVMTKVAHLHLEIASGRMQPALEVARDLGAHRGSSLHGIQLWYFMGLSTAYLRLNRAEEAREVLRNAYSNGLEPSDLRLFPDDVLDFAEQEIRAWPRRDHDSVESTRGPETSTDSVEKLTGREFQVLKMLAQKKTQGEIANEMFISLNTLKTHVKTIYRKLDVSSRDAAILRASREGWL